MKLKIGKKLKTASHNSKFSGCYKKRELLSNVGNSYNNLFISCLFLDSELTNYLKTGKLCVFMMMI